MLKQNLAEWTKGENHAHKYTRLHKKVKKQKKANRNYTGRDKNTNWMNDKRQKKIDRKVANECEEETQDNREKNWKR